MTRDELIERLRKFEWTDVEFKEARRAAPRAAYETVSAFANTAGGWLVFGVHDEDGTLEIVGVLEVDKVQGEFLSTLRSGQKLSRRIRVSESVIEEDGKILLIFHVPESSRGEKPVYLGGDIRRSFIRRGACDERCTPAEIERFLRDASEDRYDGQPLDGLDAEAFFDPASVRWYRRVFDERNPGKQQAASDLEFLNEWGFVVEHGDRLVPTRGGVLLFGRPRYLRQLLPRPVVDCQFIDSHFNSWSPDRRWADRVVAEENLVQAWLVLAERYLKHAKRPFSVDAATLRRDDDPPDYISFREAAINLLIHQDYGDHGRKASIRFFRDRTLFWNPGDAFTTTDELLDPTEKEVRNPAIVAAFRRIGLSERAGTGVRAIFRSWQRLGHVPPVIENDRAKKTFELRLLREELLSEEQRLFQAQLGVRLDETQARLFAFACREGGASLTDAKAITGRNGPEARRVLESLVVQGLLQPLEEGVLYGLTEHLVGRLDAPEPGRSAGDQAACAADDLVTDQVGAPAPDLVTDHVIRRFTEHQRQIIDACDVPRSLAELMDRAGVTHRTFFRRKHVQPLLEAGIVRMTNPKNPPAANQRYVLTEAGVELKAARIAKEGKGETHEQG
ncbi:MAG: putative DNA binding domain-containing protein [Candidatus Eisenbacteria sp.]|nr:putative DNA binding domain-containing protein [Candidatus Eisenbacteria bacterium]